MEWRLIGGKVRTAAPQDQAGFTLLESADAFLILWAVRRLLGFDLKLPSLL